MEEEASDDWGWAWSSTRLHGSEYRERMIDEIVWMWPSEPVKKMFLSTMRCAELFQRVRLSMPPIRTAYKAGISLPIESRSRGIKDLF